MNGTPLDDRDRSEQILQARSPARSEARITVIRNGQQQELTLNIAQVAQEAEGVAAQSQANSAAAGAAAAAAAAAANAGAAPAEPPPPPQVPEQTPGDSAGQ